MKLGRVIKSIEFSDAEKNRIGAAILEENSLSFKILHSEFQSIDDNDFWRSAQRRMNVTGFRDGHVTAKNMVLDRILKNLRRGGGAAYSDIWPLYKRCAVNYIIGSLNNLNRLLSLEDFNDSDGLDTEKIFASIQPRMFFYDAKIEEVRQLYELWGFDRVENFEKLFIVHGISGELVRKLVLSENVKLGAELKENLNNLKSEIYRITETDRQHILSVTEKLEYTHNKFEAAISTLRSEMQNSNGHLLGQTVEEIDRKISRITENSIAQKNNHPSVEPESVTRLEEAIKILTEKVDAQKEALSRFTEAMPQRQPTYGPPDQNILTKSIFDELAVTYKNLGLASTSSGILWFIIQMMRRSRVVITHRPSLLINLFNTIPSANFKNIVASPMWTSPLDWDDAYNFISEPDQGPRFLTISEFDVGIQEAYLVPRLISFITTPTHSCNRIILVPSKADLTAVSSRLLEFCIQFNVEDPWYAELDKSTEILNKKFEELPEKINAFDLLGYVAVGNVDFEKDLKRIASNTGAPLPPALVSQFTNMYAGLVAFLGTEKAWDISGEIALLPWISATQGESFKRVFEETMQASLGGIR